MDIFSELANEIEELNDYLTREFEVKTSHYVKKSKTKAVPMKMLIEELMTPSNCDNKKSTLMLEKIARIGIQALRDELEDKKKTTYKYLSISSSNFSFDH